MICIKNCVKNIDTHFAGKGEVTLEPRAMFIGHACIMCAFLWTDESCQFNLVVLD